MRKTNYIINKINDGTFEIKMNSKILMITGVESIILSEERVMVKAFDELRFIEDYISFQDILKQIKHLLNKKPMVPLEVNYLILNFLIWNSEQINAVIKKLKKPKSPINLIGKDTQLPLDDLPNTAFQTNCNDYKRVQINKKEQDLDSFANVTAREK